MAGTRKIPAPFALEAARLARRLLPVALWLLALGASGWLLRKRAAPAQLVGIAQPLERHVAAPAFGSLSALAVGPLERVRAGQVLALFDDKAINAEIETARMQAGQLRAEASAEEARLRLQLSLEASNRLDNRRRFEADVERYRQAGLELTTTISRDRVDLERLGLELGRTHSLVKDHALGESEFDDIRLRHGALAKSIEDNERALAQTRIDLAAAQERFSSFAAGTSIEPSFDVAVEPLRLAVSVQEKRLEELALRREALVLRSPVEGQVTQVFHGPGESIRPGDSILVVTREKPEHVVAYIEEPSTIAVRPEMEVTVRRRSSFYAPVRASVVRVGPALEQLPARLWRAPNVPLWGRPVIIAAVPELGLTPGEIVGVTLAAGSSNVIR